MTSTRHREVINFMRMLLRGVYTLKATYHHGGANGIVSQSGSDVVTLRNASAKSVFYGRIIRIFKVWK